MPVSPFPKSMRVRITTEIVPLRKPSTPAVFPLALPRSATASPTPAKAVPCKPSPDDVSVMSPPSPAKTPRSPLIALGIFCNIKINLPTFTPKRERISVMPSKAFCTAAPKDSEWSIKSLILASICKRPTSNSLSACLSSGSICSRIFTHSSRCCSSTATRCLSASIGDIRCSFSMTSMRSSSTFVASSTIFW